MPVLARTVVAGGKVYPAGTAATPSLREKIPAQFWDEPDDGAVDPGAAPAEASIGSSAAPREAGAVESVPDSTSPEPGPNMDHDKGDVPAYDQVRVADLEGEIRRRNAGRGPEERIVPASGRKADLIAALVADDHIEMARDG